jgi:hypothetical protein
MRQTCYTLALILSALAVLFATGGKATAGILDVSASGIPTNSTLPVDVRAVFTNVNNDLQIDLFNNIAGQDPLQIITGLVWNVEGTNPAGTSLASAVTGAGSGLYTNATTFTSNAELRNSVLGGGDGWQYKAPPSAAINGMNFEFGLGAAGLSGAFQGLGNSAWGLVGPGSNLAQNPLANFLPIVRSTSADPSSIRFVIAGFNADVSRLRNVTFVFGSAGTSTIVPEPGSFALAGIGLGLLLGAGRLRTRRHTHQA